MESDPGAVVRSYWERVWNDGDLDAIEELFANPYIRHSANGNVVRNHKQVREDMARYFHSLSNPDATVEDQAVSENTVWTRVTVRGVNVDTAESVVVSWIHVARVADGRIVETWSLNAALDWTTTPRRV